MNAKLYRHVFSKNLGCRVAVSEIARGAVGHAAGAAGTANNPLRLHPLGCSLALALALINGGTAHAQTLPTGGAIVGGQGHIATSGSTMTVQQNTARMAVDWKTFNIGAGDTVVFKQPSTTSVALNRVLGNNPSQIFGHLQSNGQVFLTNPNGVLFGKSAQVSVGGLFASTLPISTAAFMASRGSYTFAGGAGGPGEVINQGNLRAVNGGFIVLAANQVINSGTISASSGVVALAAGSKVTLSLDRADHALVNVDSAALSALIQNQGLVEADGGQVLLTARGRDMLQSNVMNLSGLLQANTIGTRNGRIVIDGGNAAQGDSGTVALRNLAVNALGARPGQGGGAVTITGTAIDLRGSSLNVSGSTGGGSVLIGGDARGSGGLTHALTTSMDASSNIDASAIDRGKGGTVVLWSDEQTLMNGAILARGGLLGGSGGSVETSSRGQLGVQGSVSASAAAGQAGSWLLDPTDIVVSTSADNNYTSTSYAPTANPVSVNNGSLSKALQGGTSVTLDASQGSGGLGSINVNADIASTGSGSLTLLAANGADVTLGANINLGSGSFTAIGGSGSTTGVAGGNVQLKGYALSAANVMLTGGAGGASVAGGSVNLNGSVTAAGTMRLAGGLGGGAVGSIGVNGDTTLTGGNVIFSAPTPIVLNNNLTVDAGATSSIANVISGVGSFTKAGVGTTSLTGSNTYTGATHILAGQLVLSDAAPGTDAFVNQTLYTKSINVSPNASVVLDMGGGNFAFNAGAVLSGAGTLIKKGTGLATFSSTGVSTVDMSGTIEIASGTFANSGAVDWRGNTADLQLETTTIFDLRGNDVTVGALNESGPGLGFSGFVQNSKGSNTLFVGAGDATGSFSGIIRTVPAVNAAQPASGAEEVNLAKIGAGTQTLTGMNTYTGTTTVRGGTLALGNGGTTGLLGSGIVTVNANLVIDYSSAFSLSAVASNNAGIMGSGNFTATSGGGLTIDRAINLSAGNGSILLEAGATPAGGAPGLGDITFATSGNVAAPTMIKAGESGTITLFTGSVTTAGFMQYMAGANSTTRYKTYNARSGDVAGARPGTFNFYYLANEIATLVSISKVYDGTTAVATPGNTVSLTGIEGDFTSDISAVAGGYYGTSHVGQGMLATVIPSGTMTYVSGGVTWEVAGYSHAPVAVASPNNFITPAPVTVRAGSPTKIYDGNVLSDVAITDVTGLVPGDKFTGLSQTYASSHVLGTNGSLMTVDHSGAGFNGPSLSQISDYSIRYFTNFGTIVPAPVTVTAATQNKVFDGTVASSAIMTTTPLVGNDKLTGLTQAYDSSHVLGIDGSQITVNTSGVGLSGNLSSVFSDYAIVYLTNTGTITPAPVTVTAATQSKTYDGTVASNQIVGVSPMFNGDTLTGLTQAYDNAHTLGTNGSVLTVNHSGVGISTTHGDVLSDYVISYLSTAGTITPRNLFIDLNNITKVYDGTDLAMAQGGIVKPTTADTGLVAGDSFIGITGQATYNSAHVVNAHTTNFSLGTMAVGLSGGSLASDYNMVLAQPVVAAITAAPVTVTAATQDKVFDGTTLSTAAVASVTGLINGDSLTGLSQAYESSQLMGTNGSTLMVDRSDAGVAGTRGSALSDYAINYINARGTITSVPVTLSNVTFHPNGTADLSTAVLNGALAGQGLTVESDPRTGLLTLVGPDASNYVLVNPFAFSTSFFLKRLSAMVDSRKMNLIASPEWLSVTQSPQSSQLRTVADTGKLPVMGSRTTRMSGPSTGLSCVNGAVRIPEGVVVAPIEECVGMR